MENSISVPFLLIGDVTEFLTIRFSAAHVAFVGDVKAFASEASFVGKLYEESYAK